MSHISTIELQVTDVDALEAACPILGLLFHRNQLQFRNFGGNLTDCQHAISVKGNAEAYELGVVKNPNGTFRFEFDSWNGGRGLMAVVGENCGKLAQEYAAQVAIKQARKQGLKVQRSVDAKTGKLVLKMRR